MARLIMWNLMTLDGFVEGENRDISWHLDGIVILRYEPS